MAKDPKPQNDKSQAKPTDKIFAGEWRSTGSERAVRRNFPGPRDARALLRVAFERAAYAELIAHAKESLDKEICGVLAGTVCEDDAGVFVHIAAVIRGTAANQGSTHVTFTQQTWNQIHKTLEHDYPNLQIVGWYHSHPGFGVEFSDMDLFIQRNFFSGPTQIALVTDPLSGAVAICLNTPSGIQYLDRFWVDGKQQLCQAPQAAGQPASAAQASGESSESIRVLDARISQLMQLMDEQRAFSYRLMLSVAMAIGVVLILCVGYTFYSNYRYRNEPPKLTQFVPIPVQVGNKTMLIGVGIQGWEVPEELKTAFVQAEKEKQLAAEKAAQAATNGTSADQQTKTNTAAKQ